MRNAFVVASVHGVVCGSTILNFWSKCYCPCEIHQETEDLDLPEATAHAGVLAVLEGKTHAAYYLLEQSGEVVAQLMITLEWSDWYVLGLRVRCGRGQGVWRECCKIQCPPRVRHAPTAIGPSVALANAASPHAEALC